ncbi:MAG: hypothetical protein ACYTEQ_03580 [Planctomycetota bacterium]|jgi:hypothetical protein
MAKKESIDSTKGDGGNKPVTPEFLAELKSEVDFITKEAEKGIWGDREHSHNTRYCIWDNQSADGRKHEEASSGVPPMPFELVIIGSGWRIW